ncbi:hypothetical protein COLO4_02946 [Corchorus olitorius]|uniref:B3 domain-containing protein n=1 Tax=Corchorus olitorius TaxID=93759 RepID=A0A1R3KZV1_9ROSI|nr:hypothetical protein COLO4_02946 [Corchorus olitorius]
MATSSKNSDGFDENDDVQWLKLKEEVEAENKSQIENKLMAIVLKKFNARVAMERNRRNNKETEKKKKKMVFEEKGIENYCPKEKEELVIMRKPKKQKIIITGRDDEKKLNTKVMTKLLKLGLEPPPDMPEAFKTCIENMGGTDINLVIQKIIEQTDLKKQQNRLSMTKKQIRSKFLNEEEEAMLNVVPNNGIDVTFIEPCLKVSELHLTTWNLGTGKPSFIFNKQWHQIAMENSDSLKPKAVVQVWSFRHPPDSKLGFAMIKVKDGEDGHIIDEAMG